MRNAITEYLLLTGLIISLTSGAAPLRHPILALHGYRGSAETWDDVKACLKQVAYPASDGTERNPVDGDFLVMQYYENADGGYTDLGCSTDTPIEEVAELALFSATNWLDAYHPDATFNVVCHSMGGLVFRQMLADLHDGARAAAITEGHTNLSFTADISAAGIFHRCADLGTPHFGQSIGVDKQSTEMRYASPYLRSLADAWHFRGARFTAMNYIIGNGQTLDYPADCLVNTVSASMLTRADADFSRRVAYVHRVHSTAVNWLGIVSDLPALCEMGNTGDTVFQLIHATFSETETKYGDGSGGWKEHYAENGWEFLYDDGHSANQTVCRNEYAGLASTALAFFQVLKDDDTPIEYDVGKFFNDKVINSVRNASGAQIIEAPDKAISQDSNAIESGCALVWLEQIPYPGTNFSFKIDKPYYLPSGFSSDNFKYYDQRVIYGGGGNVIRTYPSASSAGGMKDRSFTKSTCGGPVTTTTAEMFGLGLLPSDQDNGGAAALFGTVAPNGLSWPLCLKLGIVEDGTAPGLRISAAEFTDSGATIEAAFGTVPFEEIGFPYVRLRTGTAPDNLDSALAPDDFTRNFFPLPGCNTAPARFFRLCIRE